MGAHQKIIFFQEISNKDRDIAEEFGYRYIGSPVNVGIANGYRELLNATESDKFLFLENDWELIRDKLEANYIWGAALAAIDLGIADVVRLRHRQTPGNPLWTRQFEGHEYDRPSHLLDCVHWAENPEQFKEIDKIVDLWVTTSQYANWTNNPALLKTSFAHTNIAPRISGDIERTLQSWWEEQHFTIAQGEGLFTHNRID